MRFVLQPSDPDAFVTDEAGRDVYWVQGPIGRVGRWSLRDLAGAEVVAVRQRGRGFLPRFDIEPAGGPVAVLREGPDGRLRRALAALRAALVGAPPGIRYAVDVDGGEPVLVEADAAALEYRFVRAGRPVAAVSAWWLDGAETWGVAVTVADPADVPLVLAATATIEISWGRMGRRPARQPALPGLPVPG